MKNKIVEIVGWYGAGAILLAYALVSFGTIGPTSFPYQFLNLTGAIGIVILSVVKKVYQPAALNIVWAVIALIAIVKLFIK